VPGAGWNGEGCTHSSASRQENALSSGVAVASADPGGPSTGRELPSSEQGCAGNDDERASAVVLREGNLHERGAEVPEPLSADDGPASPPSGSSSVVEAHAIGREDSGHGLRQRRGTDRTGKSGHKGPASATEDRSDTLDKSFGGDEWVEDPALRGDSADRGSIVTRKTRSSSDDETLGNPDLRVGRLEGDVSGNPGRECAAETRLAVGILRGGALLGNFVTAFGMMVGAPAASVMVRAHVEGARTRFTGGM
jgi:hypothetical protein